MLSQEKSYGSVLNASRSSGIWRTCIQSFSMSDPNVLPTFHIFSIACIFTWSNAKSFWLKWPFRRCSFTTVLVFVSVLSVLSLCALNSFPLNRFLKFYLNNSIIARRLWFSSMGVQQRLRNTTRTSVELHHQNGIFQVECQSHLSRGRIEQARRGESLFLSWDAPPPVSLLIFWNLLKLGSWSFSYSVVVNVPVVIVECLILKMCHSVNSSRERSVWIHLVARLVVLSGCLIVTDKQGIRYSVLRYFIALRTWHRR